MTRGRKPSGAQARCCEEVPTPLKLSSSMRETGSAATGCARLSNGWRGWVRMITDVEPPETHAVNVLLIDDHPGERTLVRDALSATAGRITVHEAENAVQ